MKDNFSKQAAEYARYRPTYPSGLYDFILAHTQQRQAAWDCATGNGQCARVLSQYFTSVYATDISQKQIDQAITVSNVFYSVQPAEATDFDNNTFDLITVAQAMHWFKFDEFFSEVKRVAKPNATFAAWCYSLTRITPEIDRVIADYHFNTLKDYWDDERSYVDERYTTIPFPFTKIAAPEFGITYRWTLAELKGYLNTWSALQKLVADRHYNPLDDLVKQIGTMWKGEAMDIHFPIYLLMTHIEK